MRNTEEPKWLPSFCLSLSLFHYLYVSLYLFTSLSSILSFSLRGSDCAGGRVWPQSGTHAAVAPTCCSSPPDDKHNKKPNRDTDSGSVQEFSLITATSVAPSCHTEPRSDSWSQLHQMIHTFTCLCVKLQLCEVQLMENNWEHVQVQVLFKKLPISCNSKMLSTTSNEANMKKMEVKLQLWSYSTHHIGTGLTWH